MNQCDGCRRGLPLGPDGVHADGLDMIGCTADRYKNIVLLDLTKPTTIAEEACIISCFTCSTTTKYEAAWRGGWKALAKFRFGFVCNKCLEEQK